ncbi:uncharacterized protein LOC118506571 [Anopheles stephensi]|uniref:uncharacterized protein LOC118506571 n=1 Tax=Anopheles stephensi TaxID=30069 RepID=UPI001658785B|nr:uncharacterized protein LOC118506571 [Anopheles stephensi]XP_035899806.1 uncharacterized protein LOC118506571 [Anopheles stephensi]
MALAHIARIMHDSLHRGVRDVSEFLQHEQGEEFFVARNKTFAVNLLAYALGHLPPTRVTSLDQWESSSELVADRKLHHLLTALVDRMPTLEFQLIPLVLLADDRLDASFIVRVRNAPHRTPDCVYIDLSHRKYARFEQFLTANRLPACTLWYPVNGVLRYECAADPNVPPALKIESRRNTPPSGVWQMLTVATGAAASLLAFTPLGATVTIPLTMASSVFSLSDLADSCKHDTGLTVARRAIALALNLTSFASAGVTAACRVDKLRRLIPAERLLQLERTGQFLTATMRMAATGGAILTVIGTVGGWQTLSTGEWLELAALLCFAYRECFNEATAIRLFNQMQRNGVRTFFRKLCPNVPDGVLRTKLTGVWFERLLPLVMDYLMQGVQFEVDDSFATISLHGYRLQFDALFNVNWSQLLTLLRFLQSSTASISAGQKRWTQHGVEDVVELLQFVGKLRDVACAMLADYVTLGHGHRFTLGTVRAFLATAHLNKLELLKQMAALDPKATQALNELRERPAGIDGGDPELFRWLATHTAATGYEAALRALLSVAAHRSSCSGPIAFDRERIVVSPLFAFSAEAFLAVPDCWRSILLHDERFLRLCYDADERKLLQPRAAAVWLRTCCSDAIHYRDTVELLRQLFERADATGTLPAALEYALGFEGTVSVPHVYYSILSAWKQSTGRRFAPFDKRTMHHFRRLMTDAEALGLVAFHRTPVRDDELAELRHDDSALVRFVAGAGLRQLLGHVPADASNCTIPFGPAERAACWLGMIPALRNPDGRQRIRQTLLALVTSGSGRVLQPVADSEQYGGRTMDIRRLMFVRNADTIILEAQIREDGYIHFSFYLCGSTICASGAT